jgi:hypothetical protein
MTQKVNEKKDEVSNFTFFFFFTTTNAQVHNWNVQLSRKKEQEAGSRYWFFPFHPKPQNTAGRREPAHKEEMDQFAVPSQQSSITVDSAESTTATAARAPNTLAAPAPVPTPTPAAAVNSLLDDDDDAVPDPPACISSMIDRGGSVESHRLFLARRTVLEMLRDRGYTFPESELALTLPEFRAWWDERPDLGRLAVTTTLASDHSSKVPSLYPSPWFLPRLGFYSRVYVAIRTAFFPDHSMYLYARD